MSVVEIPLFNERSIARYFQLAALSVIYNRVANLKTKIERGVVTGKIELSNVEFDQAMKALVDFLDYSVKKKNLYVKLYTAGKSDRRILENVGIKVSGRRLTCDPLFQYYQGGMLTQNANARVEVPMYLRAYVFSSYRDASGVGDTNVASLYLATAGVFISMIGRVKKAENEFELYINPDASLETVKIASRMYDLLNDPDYGWRLSRIIQDIINLEGISLELASYISTAIYVYLVLSKAQSLRTLRGYYNIFERFKLVCIKPEERPLVLWERPLTLTSMLEKLESSEALDLLDALRNSVSDALKLRESVDDLPVAISSCINDLHAYLETGTLDAVVHCSAGLMRVCDELHKLCRQENNTQACNSIRTIRHILYYLNRLS